MSESSGVPCVGRRSKIGEDEKRVLCQIVEASPLATLEEVTELFCERTGLSVHSAIVRKGLREAGIKREGLGLGLVPCARKKNLTLVLSKLAMLGLVLVGFGAIYRRRNRG